MKKKKISSKKVKGKDDHILTQEESDKLDEEIAEGSRIKEIQDFEKIHGKGAGFIEGNGKKDKSKDDLKVVHVVKHSGVINGRPILAETVIIGLVPRFALSETTKDGKVKISLVESVSDGINEYFPLGEGLSRAYSFKDDTEFYYYIQQAQRESFDSLYYKVKSIWRKYIDADDFHISICSADTIFTYFQDKIGLTHYLFFVGGNDTGKSNNLTVLEYTAYRVFNSTSITVANIYTFLGKGEEGQGTICEDEADNIDRDTDKMRTYKSGYQSGKSVARTDLPQGVRTQNKWLTFCFKAFAAERLPDPLRAKGFNQRIIELLCRDGIPQHDISDVVTPAGDEDFQYLLNELNVTHNLLTAFRLLHYHDKIPNVKLNISNREKQLFKPIIRVFQNSRALNELLPVISEFVSRRRAKNTNSLEARLYEIITDLIRHKTSLELESSYIWSEIKNTLAGQEIPNKSMSYETEEFGTLSQKITTRTLEQVFGAKKSTHKGSSNKLIFDPDRLKRLERKYKIQVNVKVMIGEDGEDWGGSGLYAHISQTNDNTELAKNNQESHKNMDNSHENNEGIGSQDHPNTPTDRPKHPQTSPTSPSLLDESKEARLKKYEELHKKSLKASKDAGRIIK
jgi:hypothetical protein